jgi:hypothetical protein
VISAGHRKAGSRNRDRSQLPVVLAAKIEYGQDTRNDALGGGSACERGLSLVGRRGGVAERCHSRLGGGFPSLGRFPRTEAFVGNARERHYVRFGPRPHALVESGHESRIPPMSPTSHVQFVRPRLARRPGNHRSPAAGRRHTRRWTPPADASIAESSGGSGKPTTRADCAATRAAWQQPTHSHIPAVLRVSKQPD